MNKSFRNPLFLVIGVLLGISVVISYKVEDEVSPDKIKNGIFLLKEHREQWGQTKEGDAAGIWEKVGLARENLPKLASRLEAPSNAPPNLRGKVHIIKATAALIKSLKEDISIYPDIIATLGEERVLPFAADGVELFSHPLREETFLWAEVTGFHPVSAFLPKGFHGEVSFEWKECAPFWAKALEKNGESIPNIRIGISKYTSTGQYLNLDWRGRLKERFFSGSSFSDSSGIAKFEIAPAGDLVVFSFPQNGWGENTLNKVSQETQCALVLSPAFSVTGTILDQQGRGIPGSQLMFFIQREGSSVPIGGAVADADGDYFSSGISCAEMSIAALAVAPNFSSDVKFLGAVTSSRKIQMNFVLDQGVKLEISLVSVTSEPIEGAWVVFSKTGFDWIPFEYETNRLGVFTTEPILPLGETVLLQWGIGKNEYPSIPISVQGDSQRLVLEATGIGRVKGIHSETQFDSYSLHSKVPGTRPVLWGATESMPWAPSGPATLLGFVADSKDPAIFKVMVPEGLAGEWTLEMTETEVHFQANLPQGERTTEFELIRAPEISLFKRALENGENQFSISPGEYFLKLGVGASSWSVGPFVVGNVGLNLGKLALGQTAGIGGLLLDTLGTPIPGIAVTLDRQSGIPIQSVLTGPEGDFHFPLLGSGKYRLSVSPKFSYCPAVSSSVLVELENGEEKFVTQTLDTQLPFSLDQDGGPMNPGRGFYLIKGKSVMSSPISSSGTAFFPVIKSSCLAGVFDFSARKVLLACMDVDGGSESETIEMSSLKKTSLPGGIAAYYSVQAEINGFFLGITANVSGAENWELSYPLGFEGAFWVTSEAGVTTRLPFPASREEWLRALAGSEERVEIRVRDFAGRPIPGTMLSGPLGFFRQMVDGKGACLTSAFGLPTKLRASHPAFWPEEQETGFGGLDFSLRQTAGLLEIQLPRGITVEEISLKPDFDLGYSWSPKVAAPNKPNDPWVFRDFPEGDYLVELWNPSAVIETQHLIYLSPRDKNILVITP
jgi:hypothetical protein